MAKRIAITGAAGQLGRELVRVFSGAGDDVLALSRRDFDITNASHLARLTAWEPEIVLNTAAWTDVDGCARDPERALRINGTAAGAVAEAAAEAGAMVVQVSTNEVFDGALDRPYTEDDAPNPINPYGAAKLAGERAVVAAAPRHLVVRTSWLHGSGVRDFPTKIRGAGLRMLTQGQPLRVVADEWGNPTHVRWLAPTIGRLLELVMDGSTAFGIYHLAGSPATTRLDWATSILRGFPVAIEAIRLDEYARDSRMPPRAVLDVTRAAALGIEPFDWRAPVGDGQQ